MNHQTNRNGCSCGNESRTGTCPYGRTPWGTRETCSCGRRPWNTRSNCNSCGEARTSCSCGAARTSCPGTASTTWRNRGEGCPCPASGTDACSCGNTPRTGSCGCNNAARTGSCGCNGTRETRSTCSCEAARDGNCDEDCSHGAANTGVLDGKSLAMVYSPYQNFESLYDPRQGLCNGTIFTGLDKPFYGDGRCL